MIHIQHVLFFSHGRDARKSALKALSSLNILLFLLVSCDGSGGADRFSDPAQGASGVNAAAPYVGRAVGTTFFDNTFLGAELSNGRFFTLSGNNALAATGALNSRAEVITRRDPSVSSGMVVTIGDCREDLDDTVCFYYLDRDGNVTGQFQIDSRFPGPGKLSFDGSHIAVNLTDRVGGNSTMTIYQRDGTFVSNWSQSGAMNGGGPYDWLPDGRLVYSIERTTFEDDSERLGFVITKPYSTEPDRSLGFPRYYDQGQVISIETSSDGLQLLVNIQSRVGPSRPILVNTETFSIQQLIDREDGGVIDVDRVYWGPGDDWVYGVIPTASIGTGISLDNSLGDTAVIVGSFDSLFAFAVNGTMHPMPLSQEDMSDNLRLIPTDSTMSPGGQIGGGNFRGDFVWIP